MGFNKTCIVTNTYHLTWKVFIRSSPSFLSLIVIYFFIVSVQRRYLLSRPDLRRRGSGGLKSVSLSSPNPILCFQVFNDDSII